MAINEIDQYVGNRLREKRQRLDLSLPDLAVRLDVSFQQIQKYEQGQTKISISVLYQLAKVLHVPVDYFFEGFVPCSELKERKIPPKVIELENTRSFNLLIVEDDPDDEYLVRKALEDYGYPLNIHSVYDGEKVVDLLNRKKTSAVFPRPHLILLDINLPKFDGHMVLKAIKNSQDLVDIPVVILTNSISHSEMVSTYKNHASGYICKSFQFETFKKNMHSLITYWSQTVALPTALLDN